MSVTKIDWSHVVHESVPIIESFVARGVIPTLRTVYYALVSKNLIPNTRSAYKRLSTVIVNARKQGKIQWSHIADETRQTRGGDLPLWEPEDYARSYVDHLFERIQEFELPKWKDQPYYVEVWLEKFALAGTFQNYLRGMNITIVPSRGYSSWTFLKDAAARIQIKAEDKTPIILYYGDFDPSGEDIERFLRDALTWWNLDVEVKRIGVTEDQTKEYNLPHTPEDAEEIEKLRRDPRFKKWEHGLYRVELDALLAFVPDEFERIVKEALADYFDEDIYEEVLEDQGEKREVARDKAFELIDEKRARSREG